MLKSKNYCNSRPFDRESLCFYFYQDLEGDCHYVPPVPTALTYSTLYLVACCTSFSSGIKHAFLTFLKTLKSSVNFEPKKQENIVLYLQLSSKYVACNLVNVFNSYSIRNSTPFVYNFSFCCILELSKVSRENEILNVFVL